MPSVIGWWHNSLGWVAVAEHDYPLACAEFALAADLARADEGGEWLAPHALAALGPLTIAAGDSEQGVRLAEEGLIRARQPRLRAILIMALTSAAETAILAGNRDPPKNCSRNFFGPCETRQACGGPPTPSNSRACSSKENNRRRLPTPSRWQQRYAAPPANSEASDRSQLRSSELTNGSSLLSAPSA